jgi:ABC-2 type transport system permease protein
VTPIIYLPEQIPEQSTLFGVEIPTRSLLQMNPMAIFVDAYRDVLYDLRWPAPTQWLAMAACALGALALGALVFRRLEPRLAEEM